MIDPGPIEERPQERRRPRETKLIVLSLVAVVIVYLGGFALFHYFAVRDSSAEILSSTPDSSAKSQIDDAAVVSRGNEREQVVPLPKAGVPEVSFAQERPLKPPVADGVLPGVLAASEPQSVSPTPDQAAVSTAVSAVPPGETPPGVALETKYTIRSCWDDSGLEYDEAVCDRLEDFMERLSHRLYIFDGCRRRASGEYNTGRLNLGAEIDFTRSKSSFWHRSESELRGAEKVVECLKDELRELSLTGLKHRYARYQLTFDVVFSTPKVVHRSLERNAHVVEQRAAPEEQINRGVAVIKDRVRVRRQPVDGEIIGTISTGSNVALLDHEGGWCYVRTPRGNVGWMVCWALEL